MRIDNRKELTSEKMKECRICKKYIDKDYPKDICPLCEEMELFSEVKDYIRSNDVRESDVAEHFGIPVRKVRSWIKDGRIQYKGEVGKNISSVYCQICGKPMDFGNLCSDCRKLQGLQVVAKEYELARDSHEMHFLGKNK